MKRRKHETRCCELGRSNEFDRSDRGRGSSYNYTSILKSEPDKNKNGLTNWNGVSMFSNGSPNNNNHIFPKNLVEPRSRELDTWTTKLGVVHDSRDRATSINFRLAENKNQEDFVNIGGQVKQDNNIGFSYNHCVSIYLEMN